MQAVSRDEGRVESDSELIRRSLESPRVFEAVFERHFARVHAYAQRRVGASLADDVAAETFVRAFEARARFVRERVDALPWLLGIATRLIRRHWRNERRRLSAYARARARAPETLRADGGWQGPLLERLASLPRRQREVVLLVVWADLSYEQTADALNVPVGTVRSRLARARKRLRDAHRSSEQVRPSEIEEPHNA